jgi:hypothetical protein
MKITQIATKERVRLSALKERVLRYLEDRPDEVFSYRDPQIAQDLNLKPATQGFTFWSLCRDGLIDKEVVDGKVYFGSRRAIIELRRSLGLEKDDPFERARINAEKIKQRSGVFSVADLLNEVRGYSLTL